MTASVFGMRWFKTPEEYLAEYEPVREISDGVPGDGDRCPKCGNTNPQKLGAVYTEGLDTYRDGGRWRCKRWLCGHTWPMQRVKKVASETPEEYVFRMIKNVRAGTIWALKNGYTPDGFAEAPGPGLGAWGSIGLMGGFSDNPNTAKDGLLVAGMSMYQRHQQQQQANAEVMSFEAEAQQAWDMARAYFRIPEREAQAAKAEQDDSLRQMARVMAQEMVAEVRRQSA